jgi:uncharacterized membrane protein
VIKYQAHTDLFYTISYYDVINISFKLMFPWFKHQKTLNRTISTVDLVIMQGHVLDLVENTPAVRVLRFQILINIKVTDVTHNLDI